MDLKEEFKTNPYTENAINVMIPSQSPLRSSSSAIKAWDGTLLLEHAGFFVLATCRWNRWMHGNC